MQDWQSTINYCMLLCLSAELSFKYLTKLGANFKILCDEVTTSFTEEQDF